MSTLLGLPTELHLRIIKETDLYDLESLWTSCTTFYDYGKQDLQMNRYRKAKYETITVGWDYSTPPTHIHPLFDLRNILEDNESRFYPRVMKINSMSYVDPEDYDNTMTAQEKDAENDKIVQQHDHRITEMVLEIHRKLLPNAPTTDAMAWNEDILDAEPAATVILLLALYPHLEYLHMYNPGQECWSSEYGALFSALTAAAMDPATNTLGIFSRLSDFTLKGCTRSSESECKVELLGPFMALSKMRSIKAHIVDGRNVEWPWGTGFSQVTDVKLEACDIDTTTLTNHICAVKALESFTYTFYPSEELSLDGDQYTWPTIQTSYLNGEYPPGLSRFEPRAIVASLQSHACDTLVFLELTAYTLRSSVPFQDEEPYIKSLRGFRTLRVVKLGTVMLYGRTKRSARFALKSKLGLKQDDSLGARAPPLIDFLPASIHRFHMTSGKVGKSPSRDDVRAMFQGLPEMREERLPMLEEICVEYKENGNTEEKEGRQELQSRCKEVGIEVESIKWVKDSYGRKSQTSWCDTPHPGASAIEGTNV
ncbi:hypothetical protein IMSHALPRED_009855 [Imshaugia aleurites]|uniref:F-box domain-containing protein n=1 Tax=Imshaugia aleurites TaxID=172621 RepID=A0A8H3G1A2_9LECA|nr:hypothetical protein IMSHALPRED_009855 [Imshaugia aleurites]